MSTKKIETLQLKPSEVRFAIRAIMGTPNAMFIWGPPGISKSQTAQQVATEMEIAFIDLRLSQMDPTDLRGIPYPTRVGGVEGVRWSIPYVMPRDLDLNFTVDVLAEETDVEIANPIGSNGIHYCTDVNVEARVIGQPGVKVEVLEVQPDRVTLALYDAEGNLVAGKVRIKAKGEVRAVLALEEFNSAPTSVQAASYQLVLDRRLGEYEVPEGVTLLAMGNRDTDKGITYKMTTAISNRFVHVEMKPDFDDWQRWALSTQQHPEVVGYLSAFKNKLFEFEPGSAARGFATPRSWEFVSNILQANEDMPHMVMIGMVAGCVGDGTGAEFMEFRKVAKDLPQADEILSGRLKKMDKKVDVSLAYALTTTLCYELKERLEKARKAAGKDWHASAEKKQWMKEADNFLLFIMENFAHEICVMGAKAAIQVHKLPFDAQAMKSFEEFASKFRGLIMG